MTRSAPQPAARPSPQRAPARSGHPLYTDVADTSPGQAHGNNLYLNGGLWHEAAVSG